jgi:hypothetical protein
VVLAAGAAVHEDRGAVGRALALEGREGGRRLVVVAAVRVVLLARARARLRGLVLARPARATVVHLPLHDQNARRNDWKRRGISVTASVLIWGKAGGPP